MAWANRTQCVENSRRPQAAAEDTLLCEIIQFDYLRILFRLRSRHLSKNKYGQFKRGKDGSIVQLSRLIDSASPSQLNAVTAGAQEPTIWSRVDNLSTAFDTFEALTTPNPDSWETQSTLLSIIKQSNEITAGRSLDVTLSSSIFPDAQQKRSIVDKIRKVGRYHFISRYLIEAARSLKSLFSRVSVVPLPPVAVNPPGPITFEYALRCVSESQGRDDLESAIERYKDKSVSLVQNEFEHQLRESTTRWKVHAEIKLLLFYESQHTLRIPRVICSSKKACYLCDLFIKKHGKYFMPRTHGKLYDK